VKNGEDVLETGNDGLTSFPESNSTAVYVCICTYYLGYLEVSSPPSSFSAIVSWETTYLLPAPPPPPPFLSPRPLLILLPSYNLTSLHLSLTSLYFQPPRK
jgi:hypothetical protein